MIKLYSKSAMSFQKENIRMSLDSHLSHLTEKHEALDTIINQERQRPNPDNLKLTELKKQKLKLKH